MGAAVTKAKAGKIRRIAVTGTPCTGKTTLAAKLASKLKVPVVSINDFAIKRGYFHVNKGEKERTVEIRKVAPALAKFLSALKGGYVVEGHLACEFAVPCDVILVLRANPRILEKRFAKRKYPKAKSDENLLAEFLDYCQVATEQNYQRTKVVQIDNSKGLSADAAMKKASSRKSDFVNWAEMLITPEFSRLAR